VRCATNRPAWSSAAARADAEAASALDGPSIGAPHGRSHTPMGSSALVIPTTWVRVVALGPRRCVAPVTAPRRGSPCGRATHGRPVVRHSGVTARDQASEYVPSVVTCRGGARRSKDTSRDRPTLRRRIPWIAPHHPCALKGRRTGHASTCVCPTSW
jgi:hypothetical protein